MKRVRYRAGAAGLAPAALGLAVPSAANAATTGTAARCRSRVLRRGRTHLLEQGIAGPTSEGLFVFEGAGAVPVVELLEAQDARVPGFAQPVEQAAHRLLGVLDQLFILDFAIAIRTVPGAEGSSGTHVLGPAPDDGARWREYELPCMPGDTRRRPCLVTPYHFRLDWQMWFVGNGAPRGESIDDEPWLVHLVWQLLSGDPTPKTLLAVDPFPGDPPRWIRAGIWRYRFSDTHAGGKWWERERVGEYLAPISRLDPRLGAYVAAYGWP